MLFIKNLDIFNPYFNLASEEYILENLDGFDDISMLWRNEPSVILGANQNAYAEINLDYAEKNDINIVRRLSGGGCVYHDSGNINFSIFAEIEGNDGRILNFEHFVEPVIRALQNLGLTAELKGRNDLLLGGAKFSGNAQRVYKNHAGFRKILHHGTILFDSDMGRLSQVLNADDDKIKSKSVKSIRSRVTNLRPHLKKDMLPEEFLEYLKNFIINEKNCGTYIFNQAGIKDTEKIAEKYASPGFIFGSNLKYEFANKKRFDFGIVEIKFNVKDNKISEAKICGDFFGELDIKGLEEKLNGLAHDNNIIKEALRVENIEKYIKGCGLKKFASIIK
jgi:lipoate-protein ligase A